MVLFAFARLGSSESKKSSLDLLYSSFPAIEGPIWVSGRELTREPGGVAWDELHPFGREKVAKEVQAQNKFLQEEAAKGKRFAIPAGFVPKVSRDLCLGSTLEPPPYSGETAPWTFAGLVAEADGIIEARIVGVEPGFLQGLPASLLEVRVTRTFRAPARHAKTDTFYVFHPFARFALGGNTFCNSSSVPPEGAPEGSSAFEPEVGGRVLVFVFGPPLDRGGVLITPLPEQILYESPRGTLTVAEKLKRDDEVHPAATLDEIETILLAALRRGSGPEKPDKPTGATPSPEEPKP